MLAWHFTNGDRLRDGRSVPSIGRTLRHKGPLELCKRGLHASERLVDALAYAPGTTLHRVECSGETIKISDKLVCRERTILASADMMWALVEFAENCVKRASRSRAAAAAYAAAASAAAARAANAANAAAHAANAAHTSVVGFADRAAYYAREAAYAAYAAYAFGTEREHQNSTLELWFECMKG